MGGLVKPTREQIKQFYSAALQRCLEAFSKLNEDEWQKKVSDGWTARDHLAVLVGTHEDETMVLTRQALAGEPARIPGFENREQMAAFRQKTLEKMRGVPVPEMLQRLEDGYGEHLRMLDSLSEADLDKPAMSPAWDRPGTLRDLFFAAYLFLPAQYQEIRKAAKKKLPHWMETSTPEQVHFHLGRTFYYMPLIFRSNRAEGMEATYLFTLEGDGGGQWSVRIANGRADTIEGSLDGFDAEIRTRPELWMDLSRGELNPAWAVMTRKLHLGGNPGLAMKLSSLFSADE